MFHEEKIFKGVLHWRSTPDGIWEEYTLRDLTTMLIAARKTYVPQMHTRPEYGYNIPAEIPM